MNGVMFYFHIILKLFRLVDISIVEINPKDSVFKYLLCANISFAIFEKIYIDVSFGICFGTDENYL